MTTLIAVYNSEGCVGRCDAKCYNAKSPDCHCICGGANHGVGKQKAMDNTRDMFGLNELEDKLERWLKAYEANANRDEYTVTIPNSILQLNLF